MLRPGADPRGALAELVDRIDRSTSDHELLDIGCGNLESLLFQHEELLWDDIERLARSNTRFRRALRSVWHTSSPKYEQRRALLFELGEEHPVNLSLVAFNESLAGDDWTYRALARDTTLTDAELARVLRRLADKLLPPSAPSEESA